MLKVRNNKREDKFRSLQTYSLTVGDQSMQRAGVFSFISILIFAFILPIGVFSQSLDSSTYRLIEPTFGPVTGVTESTNYSALIDTSVANFTSTSTNYRTRGGTAEFIEANVPTISCFETDTDSGSTSCAGVPGGDGMQAVCGEFGCYERAKLEINSQANAADTRYAIQISTASDFSSNIFYVDGTTRFLKTTLTINDFLPKCEWEGTTSAGVCGSPNATWQKYNILGLTPNTTYYVRLSAQHGSSTNATFTQSEWGPSDSTTTASPRITLDVDIATSTAGSSNTPYLVNMGQLSAGSITTATDMIIFRLSTNALSGITTQIKGLNAGLLNDGDPSLIPSVNGDLASLGTGFGLRNESTTNSAVNIGTIGDITISTTPSDFTDAVTSEQVGQVPTSFVPLFNSGGLPLHTGVTGFQVKAKPDLADAAGNYSETINFVVIGVF